jgi:hypothetical protein
MNVFWKISQLIDNSFKFIAISSEMLLSFLYFLTSHIFMSNKIEENHYMLFLFFCMTEDINIITWHVFHALQLSWTTKWSVFISCKDATEIKNEFTTLLVYETYLFKKMTCIIILLEVCGSIVDWGTMLQAGRSQFRFPMRSCDFSIDLIPPAALWSLGWLSLQQKTVTGIFLGVKGGWCIRMTTSLPSVSRLSRKIWESRCLKTLWAFTTCYRDSFTFCQPESLFV